MALVSFARYQALTGDTTTAQATVEAALADAQERVEDYLRRPLESASRTETVKVAVDGFVYPKATPVTVAPSGYEIRLDGAALAGGTPVWAGVLVDYDGTTSLTYTGGYTSATVHFTVERAIARATYERLNTPTLVPAGATQVRLGDAAVTYDQPAGQSLPTDVLADLVAYRRRRM